MQRVVTLFSKNPVRLNDFELYAQMNSLRALFYQFTVLYES